MSNHVSPQPERGLDACCCNLFAASSIFQSKVKITLSFTWANGTILPPATRPTASASLTDSPPAMSFVNRHIVSIVRMATYVKTSSFIHDVLSLPADEVFAENSASAGIGCFIGNMSMKFFNISRDIILKSWGRKIRLSLPNHASSATTRRKIIAGVKWISAAEPLAVINLCLNIQETRLLLHQQHSHSSLVTVAYSSKHRCCNTMSRWSTPFPHTRRSAPFYVKNGLNGRSERYLCNELFMPGLRGEIEKTTSTPAGSPVR